MTAKTAIIAGIVFLVVVGLFLIIFGSRNTTTTAVNTVNPYTASVYSGYAGTPGAQPMAAPQVAEFVSVPTPIIVNDSATTNTATDNTVAYAKTRTVTKYKYIYVDRYGNKYNDYSAYNQYPTYNPYKTYDPYTYDNYSDYSYNNYNNYPSTNYPTYNTYGYQRPTTYSSGNQYPTPPLVMPYANAYLGTY